MTSLNPLKKVGKQIQESIEHHQGLKGAEAKKAAIEMLAKVGIPDPERRYDQYPMSSPAVCVSVWSSPLQLPAIRRC